MEPSWTLPELVGEVAARIAALPAPANGQVRAVPDDRTIRYYGTIGLLDRPVAMRGRTALYGRRHLAQVVAIKRFQQVGKSLGEIQALWATLDDEALARLSGVTLSAKAKAPRKDFWRTEVPDTTPAPRPVAPRAAVAPMELRLELAPGAVLTLAMTDDTPFTTADLRALRAAAEPLIRELARRPLATHATEGDAP